MSLSSRRLLVTGAILALAAAPIAQAQSTRTWTGLAAPDNNWTTIGNWNGAVPVSGDTALFNGSGNANTSISLGGASRPINAIQFNGTVATSYSLGVLASGDKFNFDGGGSILIASNVGVLETFNAALQTNGNLSVTNNASGSGTLTLAGAMTIGNSGTLTVTNGVANSKTTLGGAIGEVSGQPGSLSLVGTLADNTFVINGTNTYTGPTSIQVYTGPTGGIQIGSNSPFGTGTVTVTLVSGGSAPQFSATGADHTVGNAMNLNSGLTFVGSNSLALNGPLTIINAAAGGTRSLNNNIVTAGKNVTLGASPGSSTMTLGNPVSNGGDGVGKAVIFVPATGATTIVNDIMQDPATGGGAASGSVQYAGSAGGITEINSLSTYTGATLLNGLSTVQVNQDSVGSAGPFGSGTLTFNNTSNNILQPITPTGVGTRTVSNPVSMTFGITVSNAPSDTSSLTLSGPISMLANGRTITNNFASNGGTLTLGSAASPSTLTLPNTGGQTFTITGTGATIINDVIQNGSPAPSPATIINVAGGSVLGLNAQNTYTGDTTLTGVGTVIRIGASSNDVPGAGFTAGPFGTGTLTTNNSSPQTFQPFGADRSISNAINMTFGFITANPTLVQDPTGPHNLALNGPITLGATGRFITNNLASGTSLTLGSAVSPSTISVGSTLSIRTQVAGGGSTIINDAITGVGGLSVQDSAVVQLNSTSNYSGTTTVTGTGTPKLLVNGSKTGAGTVTIDSVGTLGGTGSIAGDITNNGKIAPGNGVGTLTTPGNVTFGANSHLAIDINGAADKLVVGGNLNLANVDFLDVTRTGGGLSWVIASYTGMLTGTFNNVTAGYTVNYGTGTNSQITLNANPSGLNGDFNNDGKVDAGDYVVWRKNSGTSNALPNDNGLGTPIGASHYTLWKNNYGRPPGSGDGNSLVLGATPEPTTAILLLAACAGLSLGRSRRRLVA
jgi:hypothetical protein